MPTDDLADLYTDPMEPRVQPGAVIVMGPGPVAMAFTPDAAEMSAIKLLDAASKARGGQALLAGSRQR